MVRSNKTWSKWIISLYYNSPLWSKANLWRFFILVYYLNCHLRHTNWCSVTKRLRDFLYLICKTCKQCLAVQIFCVTERGKYILNIYIFTILFKLIAVDIKSFYRELKKKIIFHLIEGRESDSLLKRTMLNGQYSIV